jgi:serine/threonine protein kinase HipA of HipAB toxin-antitoxin module
MSSGTPTKLVRDDKVESYDDPPDEPWNETPVRIEGEPTDASDLRRADDAERDGVSYAERLSDFTSTMSPSGWPGRNQYWKK